MQQLITLISLSIFFFLSCNTGGEKPITTSDTLQTHLQDTISQKPESVSIKFGDFIFIQENCGDFCKAIEGVTPSYNNVPMNHVGFKVKYNNKPYIIEAVSGGVRVVSLASFLERASSQVVVGRLLPQYHYLIDSAMTFAIRQIGLPYDQEFKLDNNKYYCSELIYDAFKYANGGKDFFDWNKMTFKEKNSNAILPQWIDYFKQLGIPVPEGEIGCNPGNMSLSDKIEIVKILTIPNSHSKQK